MQAPGQHGIDWDGVGMAAFEGFFFSVAGSSAGPVVGGLGREFWQQAKDGFEGWTSGPGLNWSGIAGSLFTVGSDALGPVLGGPAFGPERDGRRPFNFSLAGFVSSAYNPSSGWAIPGSDAAPPSAHSDTPTAG